MAEHGPAELSRHSPLDLVEQHGLADPSIAEDGLTEAGGLRPGPKRGEDPGQLAVASGQHWRVHPEPRMVGTGGTRSHYKWSALSALGAHHPW